MGVSLGSTCLPDLAGVDGRVKLANLANLAKMAKVVKVLNLLKLLKLLKISGTGRGGIFP